MKHKVIILTIIFLLSTSIATAGNFEFNDISYDHWAYEEIIKMTEAGIVEGYPDGSFRPNSLVTYGEFIKMACEVAGIKSYFPKTEHWAEPYYYTGLNAGYYTQYDIDIKVLDRSIPRGYMALIVSSMLEEYDLKDYDNILNRIEDINVRTPYEHHIVRAYSSGILAGYPDNTFRPEQPLTRAEAISVIYRLSKIIEIEEPEEPKVSMESVITSAPEDTITLSMLNYDDNVDKYNEQIIAILKQTIPNEADELFTAFIDFASKQVEGTTQGMRKQYFGDYPVLMERIWDTLRIFIFPVGHTNSTWDTEPGQINEFFF
ncbi:MAG: S-layer homology domain-containing protein [Clostridiales bacterium]|nr:S-layer homology domain-containing protein [Clostridiales bacterium]